MLGAFLVNSLFLNNNADTQEKVYFKDIANAECGQISDKTNEDLLLRLECYAGQGYKNGTLEDCEDLAYEDEVNFCKMGVAKRTKNSDICYNLEGDDMNYKDICLSIMAIEL